jgi:DNA-binding NarL/FixJ family response regulator
MCSGAGTGMFDITHVTSLREALKALNAPAFDAILLDMNLADISGIDNVRVMAGACPDVPVIVLSGAQDDQLAMHAIALGARHYLIKGRCNGAAIREAICSTLPVPVQQEAHCAVI